MRRRASALALLLALLLCGCQGKPLPAGMDEAELLEAGQEIVLLVADEDYDAVRARFREDVAQTLTAADIEELAVRQLEGAGEYRQIESRMTTGQSSNGESYGVAVFYCQFSKDDVLFRVAFDPDMALIGMEIKKK